MFPHGIIMQIRVHLNEVVDSPLDPINEEKIEFSQTYSSPYYKHPKTSNQKSSEQSKR